MESEGIGELAFLVYICGLCGFATHNIATDVLFVNANNSIKELIRVNEAIYAEVHRISVTDDTLSARKKYRDIVLQQILDNALYDVDVISVTIQDGITTSKFRRKVLKFLKNVPKEKLIALNSANVVINGRWVNVLNFLVDSIEYTREIIRFVDSVIDLHLREGTSLFGAGILKLHEQYKREGDDSMTIGNVYEEAQSFGYYMANKYRLAGYGRKQQITKAHVLRGALRAEDAGRFTDLLIGMCLEVEAPPKRSVVKLFENGEELQKIGYAFLLGFLGNADKKKQEIDVTEEVK